MSEKKYKHTSKIDTSNTVKKSVSVLFDAAKDLGKTLKKAVKSKDPISFLANNPWISETTMEDLKNVSEEANNMIELTKNGKTEGPLNDLYNASKKFLNAHSKDSLNSSNTMQVTKTSADAFVKMYREQHPGTKLSYDEILDDLSLEVK